MKIHLKTPTKIKAKRLQGFRRKMRSAAGRDTLRRRRQKGRKRLSL